MPERYAIYYAPPVAGEFWRRASIWLGRDARDDGVIEADIGGLDPERRRHLTRSARRYGFHATLKAPMALDAGLEGKDLDRALRAWAATRRPVAVGRLVVRALGGFLALVPEVQQPPLVTVASAVVMDFDGFRAQMSADERERRHGNGLTLRQQELLDRYGYPYVIDEFQFHMTLTDRIDDRSERDSVAEAARAFLAPVLDDFVMLDRLVLFREAEPGGPFLRLRDYPLGGGD